MLGNRFISPHPYFPEPHRSMGGGSEPSVAGIFRSALFPFHFRYIMIEEEEVPSHQTFGK